jgi:large subunit ribosomal protein L17
MRHRKSFNHLGRKTGHRKAMLANMATSLILHKRIQTTTAKAKALRLYVEPLLTKSKEDSTHSRRIVFSQLQSKEAVTELFREISPKIADRPGGYTRILKTGTRLGDNADMCIIELVDYNENLLSAKEEAAGKSGKRRRRGGKKKSEETTSAIAGKAGDVSAVSDVKEEQELTAESEVAAEEPIAEETKAEVEEKGEVAESSEETLAKKEDDEGETADEETKKEE